MSRFSQNDYQWMQYAIQLAKKGQLTTRPNPNVGCVIIDASGELVGEGWHQKAGEPHAEIHALKMAGEKARGGTLYVTLEPCSHYGKTPPCADAVINAGLAKVIGAMEDPNPQVAGKGYQKIQAAGIEVMSGLLASSSEALNAGFVKRMKTGLPKVTLKMAQSIDGKIALSNKQSKWVTGPNARQDVQRYRALNDAIVTGAGTVIADNPSLNVRGEELGSWSERQYNQPLRVILDGRNQINQPLKMFKLAGDTLVINSRHNEWLDETDIQQATIPNENQRVDLRKAMAYLAEKQINSVWIEAGAQLAGAFLTAKLVDEIIIYQAPKLMGTASLSSFQLEDFQSMDQVIDLSIIDTRMVSGDLKITAVPFYK